MADDLQRHFERIAWIRKETSSLAAEVRSFTQNKPFELSDRLVGPWNPPRRQIYVKFVSEPPGDIAIHAGTLGNELRSILNALVVTLARRNGATKFGDLDFPIAKDFSAYQSSHYRKRIRKLSPADQALIDSVKPYAGGNDLLHAFHNFDRTRKHIELIETTLRSSGMSLGSGTFHAEKFTIAPNPKTGDIVALVSADTNVFPEYDPIVCFSEPPFLKGKDLILMLNEMTSLVEAILKLFD